MLAQLHRRYDRLSERWQTAILCVVVSAVLLASSQPWSRGAVLVALAVSAALVGSRIRHLEGR